MVHSAERTFLKGGLFDGALGLTLAIHQDSINPSFGADFSKFVQAVLEVPLPQGMPIVRISGDVEKVDPSSMSALLKALTHYRRNVQVVMNNPGEWPSWWELVSWKIIRTTTPLVVFPADEIWYKPNGSDNSPIEDLVLPPEAVPSKRFLYLDRTLSVDKTEEFFLRSSWSWCLL